MPNKPDLMNETINLIALARETALNKGDTQRAEKFKPIEEGLREIISRVWKEDNQVKASLFSSYPAIQTLVDVANDPSRNGLGRSAAQERNQIVASMSAEGMDELEIARNLGNDQRRGAYDHQD